MLFIGNFLNILRMDGDSTVSSVVVTVGINHYKMYYMVGIEILFDYLSTELVDAVLIATSYLDWFVAT